MTRVLKKQIDNNKIGVMTISSFSATGTSNDISLALATASAVDGVTVIPSNGTESSLGFLVTSTINKVRIIDSLTKELIGDTQLNEVYGRITESLGVYTISYYSLQVGVETSISITRTIDIFPEYNFEFKDFPHKSDIRLFDSINDIVKESISSSSITSTSNVNQIFDIVEIDATGGNIIVTLGDILTNSITKNKRMTLKRIDSSLNTVTINGTASNYEDEGLDLAILEGTTIYASNSNIWRSID